MNSPFIDDDPLSWMDQFESNEQFVNYIYDKCGQYKKVYTPLIVQILNQMNN